MKIAVILPSRGLIFSQTCEELLQNLESYDYDIFFSHGLPIPLCFNKPLRRALKGPYSHVWFVEEDMILPKGVLKSLLKAKVPAICCDYPVSKEGKASVFRDPDGNAIWGGTGCLLVTREFIEKQPPFRTDIAWDMKIGERLEMTPRKVEGNMYGLHDITFGLTAYRDNPIKVSDIKCGQRRLKAMGAQATNKGEHIIEEWTKLVPETLQVSKVTNRNVTLSDGTIAYMDIKRAEALAKEGKVTMNPHSWVDIGEL